MRIENDTHSINKISKVWGLQFLSIKQTWNGNIKFCEDDDRKMIEHAQMKSRKSWIWISYLPKQLEILFRTCLDRPTNRLNLDLVPCIYHQNTSKIREDLWEHPWTILCSCLGIWSSEVVGGSVYLTLFIFSSYMLYASFLFSNFTIRFCFLIMFMFSFLFACISLCVFLFWNFEYLTFIKTCEDEDRKIIKKCINGNSNILDVNFISIKNRGIWQILQTFLVSSKGIPLRISSHNADAGVGIGMLRGNPLPSVN